MGDQGGRYWLWEQNTVEYQAAGVLTLPWSLWKRQVPEMVYAMNGMAGMGSWCFQGAFFEGQHFSINKLPNIFYFFIPFGQHLPVSPTNTPHLAARPWQPPYYYPFLWVWLFLDSHMSEITSYLSISVWHISISAVPSRAICVVTSGKLPSVLRLNNIPYMSHFLYPFIHRWTPGLFPYLGDCK